MNPELAWMVAFSGLAGSPDARCRWLRLSFKLVSDQSLIGSGVASVRKKLPRW
jgi:hypothetical protein